MLRLVGLRLHRDGEMVTGDRSVSLSALTKIENTVSAFFNYPDRGGKKEISPSHPFTIHPHPDRRVRSFSASANSKASSPEGNTCDSRREAFRRILTSTPFGANRTSQEATFPSRERVHRG